MMTFTDLFRNREDNENNDSDRDTPSGVATPQPDPSDKRLPGIMHSYFGQVGSGSSTSPNSGPLETPAVGSEGEIPPPSHHREAHQEDEVPSSVTLDSYNETPSDCYEKEHAETLPVQSNERMGLPLALAPENSLPRGLHPYPTPPVSQPSSQSPSLHKLKLGSEDEEASLRKESPPASASAQYARSISESIPSNVRRQSLMNPLSSVVTASNVHAAHFSNPSDPSQPTAEPSTPSRLRLNSEFHESPSYERLKRLTDDASRQKSTPATPTRALSNQTIKSDASGGSDPSNVQNGKQNLEAPPSHSTLSGNTGAPAPAPKGKLTVKIAEARGLRKSRDPYVVAVFQRNELVSKGPLPQENDENEDATGSPMMGGIPITRSGSDSGRAMAIPMKSRQSSNTSLSDYRDFKVKGRKSMTNPKWDTEAVL
jgi:hypothetical protein